MTEQDPSNIDRKVLKELLRSMPYLIVVAFCASFTLAINHDIYRKIGSYPEGLAILIILDSAAGMAIKNYYWDKIRIKDSFRRG